MVIVRQINPRRVGLPVLAWAILVGFLIFLGRTTHHLGISSGASDMAYVLAGFLTIALGFWLGWQRRTGTAFAAPFLAWIVLVPFGWVSEFVVHGFFGGLWRGFFFAIIGGAVATFIEFVLLVSFAVLGRVTAAALGHGHDDTTVILPPRTY